MASLLRKKRDWQEVVSEKKRLQQEAISIYDFAENPANSDIEEGEKSITDKQRLGYRITDIADTEVLAELVVKGKVTSEAVTKAYITNLTEILFDKAISRARELDRHLEDTGEPLGPFHGVPMTLKDQFNIAGVDTTIGYVGRAFRPQSDDAVLVKMLQTLGAVLIAKTNLPQGIMWGETDNPLWGLTTNPMNPSYTPGGSTGGESALLALQGSVVGWGTDLGGSVRIPPYIMGLYGLKPSSARLPYHGVAVSAEGQDHIPSSVGPLARSLCSIYHVMRELVVAEPWVKDCRCVPIPWRSGVYEEYLSRKLTIGVLIDDGVVRPHPAIVRVVKRVAAILAADGHILTPWNADFHRELVELMDLYYTVDGGEDIRRDVEAGGEPYIPHVEMLINRAPAISVYEYWQLNKRRRELQQAYHEKWNDTHSPITGRSVDIILMPVMPHAAVPHRSTRWAGYTKVWNALDYTALAIPAGRIEEGDCDAPWEYEARNNMDEFNARLWSEQKRDMAKMALPLGIQIVGRKLEEEKVLAVGKVIDDMLRAHNV